MTDRIRITDFRDDVDRALKNRDPDGKPIWRVWNAPSQEGRTLIEAIPALLDAVQALRRLVAATDPYGLDNESTPFNAHTEFAAAIFAAKERLERFDFTDT